MKPVHSQAIIAVCVLATILLVGFAGYSIKHCEECETVDRQPLIDSLMSSSSTWQLAAQTMEAERNVALWRIDSASSAEESKGSVKQQVDETFHRIYGLPDDSLAAIMRATPE